MIVAKINCVQMFVNLYGTNIKIFCRNWTNKLNKSTAFNFVKITLERWKLFICEINTTENMCLSRTFRENFDMMVETKYDSMFWFKYIELEHDIQHINPRNISEI